MSVLGDSLGILAAEGLTDAFADRPEISITNMARDLSGLTRDDYYDWPKGARDLVAGNPQINVVVIMIGINDLQPLKESPDTLEPLGDKWRQAYAQRVESLVAPFHGAHVPILWVGLPPMRDERFSGQASALNEIYREHAESAGAKYIDIWDAFADQNGQYAAFGPDVEGQNVKLRSGPNGIYFTKAGARKLAQFIEPDIRHAIDKSKPQGDIASLPPDIEREADDINAQIRREMGAEKLTPLDAVAPAKRLAGPILPLTARPMSSLGAIVEILGAAPEVASEQTRALRLGQAPGPRAGRADDFSWPRLE